MQSLIAFIECGGNSGRSIRRKRNRWASPPFERQQVPGTLALLSQRGPRRARGGVFIRSRPPSCAGDRALRMGTKMGGTRRCFRISLEYLANLV
jgi:hypothetical protein